MTVTLRKVEEIQEFLIAIRSSAKEAQLKLAKASEHDTPLELLYKIKYEKIGHDPLDQQRSLNIVEQVNQTFTYLASFKAAKMLFSWHSGLTLLRMNLGTTAGTDIESDYNGGISAEVFAAVTPANNNKLKNDIAKVSKSQSAHKYVFFMCPNCVEGEYRNCEAPTGMIIWSLGTSTKV